MAIKGILTLAMILGVAYGGIKGCDKADGFLKSHKSYSVISPAYGYMDGNSCNDIREYEKSLEAIPDQIQDIVNDHHGRVYFYEPGNKLVDSGNSKTNQRIAGFYTFWDPVRGIEKGMFVSCINEDKTQSNTALHEFGHAVDEFLGEEFFGKRISETGGIQRMCEQYNFKVGEHFRTPIEFFAKMTEEYYRTDESRKNMEKEFPEMFEFYQELEEKAVERGITSRQNLVSETLFDIFMVKTGIAPNMMRWFDKIEKRGN